MYVLITAEGSRPLVVIVDHWANVSEIVSVRSNRDRGLIVDHWLYRNSQCESRQRANCRPLVVSE